MSLDPSPFTIDFEPPDGTDSRWCIDQYFAELAARFEGGFKASADASAAVDGLSPPSGCFLLARLNGSPVGCGGLKRLDDATGEIKRVWVAPAARGVGLAGRIVTRLEAIARERGFARLRLDTNQALTQARAMYANRGYVEIAKYNDNPYAHHWFEKALG